MRKTKHPPNPVLTAHESRDADEPLPLWPVVMLGVAAAAAVAWIILMIWALRHMFLA